MTASADICRDHATCQRNEKFFRGPQECLTCERRPATHFLNGVAAIAPRCDVDLLSSHGCPHVEEEGDICAECFDFVTLNLEFPDDPKLPEVTS